MENNEQLLRDLNQTMTELLKFLKKQDNPWCDADEAAELLGLKLSQSNHHRRIVRWFAMKGFIKRFRAGRPYTYWKTDIQELSVRISKGEVYVPSQV